MCVSNIVAIDKTIIKSEERERESEMRRRERRERERETVRERMMRESIQHCY